MQAFWKTEFTNKTGVDVGVASKDSLLRVHGPSIIQVTQIEVHSDEEGNSGVADKAGEPTRCED